MSYTKYVMDSGNKFILMSKLSGLDHGQLSLLLEGEAVSAGFVTVIDGQIVAYGQSITLGLRSREEDTLHINTALTEGRIRRRWDDLVDRYFAGTMDHLTMEEDSQTIESMVEKKILEL